VRTSLTNPLVILDLQIFAIKMASAEEARGERTRLQIAQSNTRRYKSYESVGAFLYARPEDRRKSKNDNEFAVHSPHAHSCRSVESVSKRYSHSRVWR
jgi:hypothetical protein